MSSQQAAGTPGSGAMSERMQVLLSRAAEEQLLEQRQVSAVLGELRALMEDVDERLATGEQVERVAAEVRALSARVEARLDTAEARSAELAEGISQATVMAGQAAQDLVDAVAAGVAERVEARLKEVTAGVAASVGDLLEGSERRLATHVDDAVLALAEVVLRRRRPAAPAAPALLEQHQAADVPSRAAVVEDEPPPRSQVQDCEPRLEDGPAPEAAVEEPRPTDEAPVESTGDDPAPVASTGDDPASDDPTVEDLTPAEVNPDAAEDPARPEHAALPAAPLTVDHVAEEPSPGDGFVLVPSDVEQADTGPAPPVQQERRTADRRTSERSDGSGRRRRPWWRPV